MDQIITNLVIELRRGVQIIVVLQLLKKPQYGYSLLSILESNGIEIEAGTLYPLLRRLESQKLLESTWDTTESRPRKFYEISDYGIEVLNILIKEWTSINKQINNVLTEA
jgi:DNA-binding PadR family transcriptional regulator